MKLEGSVIGVVVAPLRMTTGHLNLSCVTDMTKWTKYISHSWTNVSSEN